MEQISDMDLLTGDETSTSVIKLISNQILIILWKGGLKLAPLFHELNEIIKVFFSIV